MQWDYKDLLQATAQQTVNNGGTPETTYYVYDASGQRVRKVINRQNGTRQKERIYLGGFEIYREYNGAGGTTPKLERETLHIMDDKQRIALVETRTQGNDPAPQQLIRYQFGNHLGSACLELDDQAQVISYEEYTSYGSTSYQAMRSQTETPKRYRYTGKERDEESGLYYHGARYYAPWLGRWTACDPIGMKDGLNLYVYGQNNPSIFIDTNGARTDDAILHDQHPQKDRSSHQQTRSVENINFDEGETFTRFKGAIVTQGEAEILRSSEAYQKKAFANINARNRSIENITHPDKFKGILVYGNLQLMIASQVFSMLLLPVIIGEK